MEKTLWPMPSLLLHLSDSSSCLNLCTFLFLSTTDFRGRFRTAVCMDTKSAVIWHLWVKLYTCTSMCIPTLPNDAWKTLSPFPSSSANKFNLNKFLNPWVQQQWIFIASSVEDLWLLTGLMFNLRHSRTNHLGSRSVSDLSEKEAARDTHSL